MRDSVERDTYFLQEGEHRFGNDPMLSFGSEFEEEQVVSL